jgi:hypothetical protein
VENFEVNPASKQDITVTLSLSFQAVKHNRNDCTLLLEQTHELLNAIIVAHTTAETGGELPTNILSQIGKFTEYVKLSSPFSIPVIQ